MTGINQPDACYLAALRLLTSRDYAQRALEAKLGQRGFEQQQVLAAIKRLQEQGYLNDRRYAERLVESALQSGKYVGYRLQQELQRRGIPLELAAELLQQAEPRDQLSQAQELVQQRYPAFSAATADDRERRRIAGFLQRRGFRAETVFQLLDRRYVPE